MKQQKSLASEVGVVLDWGGGGGGKDSRWFFRLSAHCETLSQASKPFIENTFVPSTWGCKYLATADNDTLRAMIYTWMSQLFMHYMLAIGSFSSSSIFCTKKSSLFIYINIKEKKRIGAKIML